MATLENINVGSKVAVHNTPYGELQGEVIAVNDPMTHPGKHVGVRLNDHHPRAHSCDGATDEGYGWYATPEQIAIIR